MLSHSSATAPIPVLNTEQLLAYGLAKWNTQPGAIWNICGEWDAGAWQALGAREGQIFNGDRALKQPGPFKRLGAFVVLNQYWPCFRLRDSRSGQWLSPEAAALWAPRLTVWLLPFYARGLAMNGSSLTLKVECPTPHFQADLIGHLRSLFRLLDQDPDLREEWDLLTERILSLGLTIEAATYAATSGMEPLRAFVTAPGNCFERCDPAFKDELMIDIIFNEPRFLTDATDIGLD